MIKFTITPVKEDAHSLHVIINNISVHIKTASKYVCEDVKKHLIDAINNSDDICAELKLKCADMELKIKILEHENNKLKVQEGEKAA